MRFVIPLVQFLPLTVFVVIARMKSFGPGTWGVAFQIGGLMAALETLLLVWRHVAVCPVDCSETAFARSSETWGHMRFANR